MTTPNTPDPILAVVKNLTDAQKARIDATISSLSSYELDYIILLAQKKLTQTRGMQLLPPELVGVIVSYLDFGSLLNCARTCKSWRDIFTSDNVVRVVSLQNFPFQDIRCWEDLMNNVAPVYKRAQLQGPRLTWDISALGAIPPVALSQHAKDLHPEARKLLRSPKEHNKFLQEFPRLGHPIIPPPPGEESAHIQMPREAAEHAARTAKAASTSNNAGPSTSSAGPSTSSAGPSTTSANATPAGPPRPPVFGPPRPPHLQPTNTPPADSQPPRPSAGELLADIFMDGGFESEHAPPAFYEFMAAEIQARMEAEVHEALGDELDSDFDEDDDMEYDSADDPFTPFWGFDEHMDVAEDLRAYSLADNRIVCLHFDPKSDHGENSKYLFFDTTTGRWFHPLDGSTHPELVDRGFPGSEQITGHFPLMSINLGREWFVWNFQTGVLEAIDVNPGNSSIFHFGNDVVTIDTESKVTFWYWSDAGKFTDSRPPLLGKKRHMISRGTYDIMGLVGERPYTAPNALPPGFGDHFNHTRPVSHVIFHPKIPGKCTLFYAVRPPPNAATEWHWKATPATIRILHFEQYKFVSSYSVDLFNTMHPTNSNCWDWWEPQAMFTEGLWALGHSQMEDNSLQPDFTKMEIYDIVNGKVSTLPFPIITPNDFSRVSYNNMYSGINSMFEFIPMGSPLCIRALLDSFGETLSPGARSIGTRPFCLPGQGARYADVRVPNLDADIVIDKTSGNQREDVVTMPFTKVEVFEKYLGPKDAPYQIPVWEKVPIEDEVD